MTSDQSGFENEIRTLVGRLVAESTSLVELGIRPEVEVHSKPGPFEIAIYFYRDSEVVDVLEFFVTKDGVPTATVADVETWVTDALRDVSEKAAQAAGGGDG